MKTFKALLQNSFKEYKFTKNLNHLSYEDFAYNLNETPVAMEGDMPNILKDSVLEISRTGLGLKYKKEGILKDRSNNEFLIYSLKDYYIVGNWGKSTHESSLNEVVFSVVAFIDLIPHGKYHVPHQVAVQEKKQHLGIAYALYKFLLNEKKYELMSDGVQFFGARKLWKKLSLNGVVDVIDINTNEIILKNIKLKQGNLDNEIDKRVYSEITDFFDSKENIRLILRKI